MGFCFNLRFEVLRNLKDFAFLVFLLLVENPRFLPILKRKFAFWNFFFFLRFHVLKYGGFGCLVAFLIWV